MRVLLVRHGQAVDSYEADSDGHRWLTAYGRRSVRSVAHLLTESGLKLERIFTSPLVRAVQTAEIIASDQGFEAPLEVWPALAGGTTAMALGALEQATDEQNVALVGHEPLIRAMTAHLIGYRGFPGFRPGAACLVELRDGSGAFQWHLDPKTLTRIETLDDLSP